MAIDMIQTSKQFGTCRIGEVHGQAGIKSRLLIDVNVLLWNVDADEQAARLLSFEADVSIRGADNREVLVGRAVTADQNFSLRQYKTRAENRLRLALDLTRSELDAWERARQGKPFTLGLAYHGLAFSPSVGVDNLMGSDNRSITQSEWVTALDELGYRKTVLVEVPVPDEREHPALATAARELAHATSALLTGPSRTVVASCRQALEALAHAIGEDPTTYNIVDLVRNNPRLDKPERFAVLRKALTIVCHPAHHADPAAAAIDWEYEDAVVLVAETAAVLRYHAARLPPSQR